MDFIEITRQRLLDRKGRWRDAQAATGLKYGWIGKFARGVIREPGAMKLQKLLDWLDAQDARAARSGDSAPADVA